MTDKIWSSGQIIPFFPTRVFVAPTSWEDILNIQVNPRLAISTCVSVLPRDRMQSRKCINPSGRPLRLRRKTFLLLCAHFLFCFAFYLRGPPPKHNESWSGPATRHKFWSHGFAPLSLSAAAGTHADWCGRRRERRWNSRFSSGSTRTLDFLRAVL